MSYINNPGGGSGVPTGDLTVGTTVIHGGVPLQVLYDNSGVLGEYTQSGLTAYINLFSTTTTLSGTVPGSNGVSTANFLRSDRTWAVPPGGAVTPAALSTIPDTNITLTLTGTPLTALLQATTITAGWAGTLAAARLNANVVQAVTNDTNVTGGIASQTLGLGWTGSLAIGRGGTGITTYTLGDILYSNATNSLAKLPGNISTTKAFLIQTGTGSVSAAPAWGAIARADVPVMIGDTGTGGQQGLVPAPPAGTGTTEFLRADGTFAVPPTGGTGSPPGPPPGSVQFNAGGGSFGGNANFAWDNTGLVLTINGGDIKIRDIYTNDTTFLHRTLATLATLVGTNTPTITNCPASGDPVTWLEIDNNGQTLIIPAWLKSVAGLDFSDPNNSQYMPIFGLGV